MENDNLISVAEFCRFHQVDIHFIESLEQTGLIQTTLVQHTLHVHADNLGKLEKYVRLNQDLEIGADNLDIVAGLLARMEFLQEEIKGLQNRLGFYEKFENHAKQPD
jgi:chaperone modulatory protein CbpM